MTTPADTPAIVLSIDQPYASLIMLGVKRFETRPAPPNGDMRPDGVRGLPGARVNRGDRLLIASTARTPKVPSSYGLWWVDVHQHIGLYMDHEHDMTDIRLPLGCILGSVTVTNAYPIVADPMARNCVDFRRDQLAFRIDTETPGRESIADISDQLPLGDWTPGRWAWALTDPEPLPEPIPVTGKQGVWRWQP